MLREHSLIDFLTLIKTAFSKESSQEDASLVYGMSCHGIEAVVGFPPQTVRLFHDASNVAKIFPPKFIFEEFDNRFYPLRIEETSESNTFFFLA